MPHIRVRGKGELYDYTLKRLVADELVIECRESLQSLKSDRVELKNDIRLKGYYIAVRVVCQAVIFKIVNKNADFDPNNYDIEMELAKRGR